MVERIERSFILGTLPTEKLRIFVQNQNKVSMIREIFAILLFSSLHGGSLWDSALPRSVPAL